jgi:hypothetical protein
MIGPLKLWSLRRKLRGSIPRDPLTTLDPGPWLDAAASVTHLRATCTQPNWLVHCAYWAGVSQDKLLEAALAAGQHVKAHAPELFPELGDVELRRTPFPELAGKIHAIERKHPAIKAIEGYFPSGGNFLISQHLGDRHPRKLPATGLAPGDAIAAGYVLMIVAVFHRERGLREALALVCGAAATMFALGAPAERKALLDLQRSTYGWASSMTNATFVK